MGSITPAEFIARFSEFSGVSPVLIQDIIDEVVYFLRPYQGSGAYRILQLYLTAHMLFIQQKAIGGGAESSNPLASATVGSVSAGYAVNAGGMSIIESQWNSTSYGQTFYIYLKQARYQIAPYAVI
ncbi:DUF4054 domain-containing protein [bacterium]|nr:DUF4054 domain-containing protein [bacterium]